jgi:hypothetical protein
MKDLILSSLAIATLLGFLAVLLWEVPRIDLGVVIALTAAFAIWDLFASHEDGSG